MEERHLDIPNDPHNRTYFEFAQTELLKINSYRAPRDKLICILNCCIVLFGLIRHMEGESGADRFLPLLIYVVIKADPEQLVSNVKYIERFRQPAKLESEAGYYLTNLVRKFFAEHRWGLSASWSAWTPARYRLLKRNLTRRLLYSFAGKLAGL